jgi:hypothetical protein
MERQLKAEKYRGDMRRDKKIAGHFKPLDSGAAISVHSF